MHIGIMQRSNLKQLWTLSWAAFHWPELYSVISIEKNNEY